MTTTTILLLLAAAASTIAFSPPGDFHGHFAGHPSLSVRRRRDISAGSKSGSGAVAFSSSSSSSSGSGSGSGPGYATSISTRSGYPPDEGLNSVNPVHNSVNPGVSSSGYGTNDFNFPNPAYVNPYQNPYGGGYVPVDFNRVFQQYMEFMQRLAQQQAAYVPNDIHTRGGFGPDNYGPPQNGFYFPGANNYGPGVGNYGPAGGNYGPAGGNYGPGGGNYGGTPGDGHVSASASASLSPRGGFGSASISPAPHGDPGLATRMGSFPASGDGNFAVFSSSSSGSSDVNGERKSFKEATSVVNDNGKVTTFHVKDP